MDPDPLQVEAAARIGCDRIELYTEPYARAFDNHNTDTVLLAYAECARTAHRLGMGVNAGHDLNQTNLGPFLDAVPHVAEVSIGHALIAEALFDGLAKTVSAYVDICARAA